MSIKVVQPEIERFLSDREPGVLVMAGKWGVGKTFAWNLFLKHAKEKGVLKASHYAYVSLFGLGNLEDLKAAIFQNTVNNADIGKNADLDTLQGVVDAAPMLWRKGGALARLLPGADKYLSSFERVGFFWIKEQVICIDDLERKSRGLDLRDVLGLISYLKEQRKCKVVLLLNDEKLGDGDGAEFRTQLEKVADVNLRFDPTPEEAAHIGVDVRTAFHEELRGYVEKLGIVNIRTIRKIERICIRLAEELTSYDPRVVGQAIQSAALFGFAKFQPDDAPPPDFIRGVNTFEDIVAQQEGQQPDTAWRALIAEYGFSQMDEFDAIIWDIVQQGHVDREALNREAAELQRRFQAADQDQSFSEAWDLYHGSFENNGDLVTQRLADAIQTCPRAITPMNLSRTIVALKELGWPGDINALISGYVNAWADEGDRFWDLDSSAFGEEVRDPDVRQAFAQKLAGVQVPRDIAELLIEIGKSRGWDPNDVDFLAAQSPHDLYQVFKDLRGAAQRRAVAGALMFRNIGNASDSMRQLTANATAALRQVAEESPINRRRVLQLGITLPDAGGDDLPPAGVSQQ